MKFAEDILIRPYITEKSNMEIAEANTPSLLTKKPPRPKLSRRWKSFSMSKSCLSQSTMREKKSAWAYMLEKQLLSKKR